MEQVPVPEKKKLRFRGATFNVVEAPISEPPVQAEPEPVQKPEPVEDINSENNEPKKKNALRLNAESKSFVKPDDAVSLSRKESQYSSNQPTTEPQANAQNNTNMNLLSQQMQNHIAANNLVQQAQSQLLQAQIIQQQMAQTNSQNAMMQQAQLMQNQLANSQNISGLTSISDIYNLNDTQKQVVVQQYTTVFMQSQNAKTQFKVWVIQNAQMVVFYQSNGYNEEQIYQNWALQHVQNLISSGLQQYEYNLQRAALNFKEHIMQAGIDKWLQMSKEQQDEYQMNWIKVFNTNLSQTINLQLFGQNFRQNNNEGGNMGEQNYDQGLLGLAGQENTDNNMGGLMNELGELQQGEQTGENTEPVNEETKAESVVEEQSQNNEIKQEEDVKTEENQSPPVDNKATEQAEKQPENVQDAPEETAAEEPVQEEIEEEESEQEPAVEEVDPSTLPQERPARIRYTKKMIQDFIKKDVNKKLPETMKNLNRKVFMEKQRPKKSMQKGKFPYQQRPHQPEITSQTLTLNISVEGKGLCVKNRTPEEKISVTAMLDNAKQKKEVSNHMNEKIGMPIAPQDNSRNNNRYNKPEGGYNNYNKGNQQPQLILEVSSSTRHFQYSVPLYEIPFRVGAGLEEKIEEINLSKFSKEYQGVIYLKMFKADGLSRHRRTPSQEAKYQQMNSDTGFSNKVATDDLSKKKQAINLVMQQITRENFDEIQAEIIIFCNDPDLYDQVIKSLVAKARTHQQFTELYAELCCNLTTQKYDWDQEKGGSKVFKEKVVAEIREEFFNGFEDFKKWVSAEKNKVDNDAYEFLIRYNKKKNVLMGNIKFIAFLYNKGFLSHKVIRMVAQNLIEHVSTNLCARKTDKKQEEQVYLEALIKLLDFSGKTIEDKDKKNQRKTPVNEQLKNSYIEFLDSEIRFSKKESFDLDLQKQKFPDFEFFNNCVMESSMAFLECCMDYDIRVELGALIENLFDKRKKKWANTIYDKTGPKTLKQLEEDFINGKKKLYGQQDSEGEEDYYTQRNNHRRPKGVRQVEEEDEYVLAKNPDRNLPKSYGSGRDFKTNKKSPYQYENTNKFATYQSSRFNKVPSGGEKKEDYDDEEKDDVKRLNSKVTEEDVDFNQRENVDKSRNQGRFERKNSSNKEVMLTELRTFLKNNKNMTDKDTYFAWFFERKEDWNKTGSKPGYYLFEGFFSAYSDCHKAAGEVRGTLVAELYRLIEDAKKSDFIIPWARFTAQSAEDGSFEDVPHLKVSLANMMYAFVNKLNWSLSDFEFQYNPDPMYAEEQIHWYKQVFDEMKKLFNADGNTELANAVDKIKNDLKVPE